LAAWLLASLAACNGAPETPPAWAPMVTSGDGRGPWLLVTYQGQKLTVPKVRLLDGDVSDATESVFVTNEAALVRRSGRPVTDREGVPLFWHKNGTIVRQDGYPVDETLILSLGRAPLPAGTAFRVERRGEFTQPGSLLAPGADSSRSSAGR
tara:strand:+ start:1095 stop:1550 length:456 start_codon:yes stop_codon:yes gene_type:complete